MLNNSISGIAQYEVKHDGVSLEIIASSSACSKAAIHITQSIISTNNLVGMSGVACIKYLINVNLK
jgi:hypothetical protein